jgi:hypothetical protein
MQGDPVSARSTLAVILGASEYPNAGLDPLKPAANSARDFERYLRSEAGLNLPGENVHNLFDSALSPHLIDDSISTFLKTRQERLMAEGSGRARDLIFYYVGHGGFTPGDQEYFLALRTTTKDREGPSSLRMVDLAGTLAQGARNLRRYLILDCCFASSAYEYFQQSDPVEGIRRKTLDSMPRKGTALLCSSSASNVSLTPKHQDYTMFTGVLLEVLHRGVSDRATALSLADVGAEVLQGIKETYGSKAVRPKVISPDEREGDIASVPLFPNPTGTERPDQIQAKAATFRKSAPSWRYRLTRPSVLTAILAVAATGSVVWFVETRHVGIDSAAKPVKSALAPPPSSRPELRIGIDAAVPIDQSSAACLVDDGTTFAARYYSSAPRRAITHQEAVTISNAGLQIVAVFEDNPTTYSYFSYIRGKQDAATALGLTATIGQPPGSAVYFGIEYDPSVADIQGAISDYFSAVNQTFAKAGSKYIVGVYGSGMANKILKEAGLVKFTWLAASQGFLGFASFKTLADLTQRADRTLPCVHQVGYDVAHVPEFGAFTVGP